MRIDSKLPNVGTTIFTTMSALAAKHEAVNLSQGFPNFDPPQELKDLIKHHLQDGKNQYAPMQGVLALREKLAEKFDKLYGVSVDAANEINITAGGTQAIFTTIQTFVSEGDEVILIEPCFDCYAPAIQMIGAKVVPYELSAPDYKIDWTEFAQLLSRETRMIIINTPHNPIGKTLKKEDMEALESLTNGSDILVLSDEVYEHIIFDQQEHQTVLKFPELRKRSLAVYSFGKTYHATGWKIGYVIAPSELMAEFRKVHQFNVFTVNSFMQYALCDYLDVANHYLGLADFYQEKRDLLNKELQGSGLLPIQSEGTYFQLFDYSELSDLPDQELCIQMTRQLGIAAIPVSVFYTSEKDEKVIRLCFAKTNEILIEGTKRLRRLSELKA